MNGRHVWTEEEVKLLSLRYADTQTAQLAAQLVVSVDQVYSKAAYLGLKKSQAYLSSTSACRLRMGDAVGKGTRFQPGKAPWNKGIAFIAGGRSAETRFKPGNRTGSASKKYQPIGTERISKDGYLERKINRSLSSF